MNDRDLLELAAKAAGVDFYTPEGMDTPWCGRGFYLRGCAVWNPLENDGDALRLAVKLKLGVDTNWYNTHNCEFTKKTIVVSTISVEEETHKKDPYAATRRAIVRAAAEIGRNMK